MRIEILGKNYTPSDKLKDIINKKMQKLDKYFVAADAKIVCAVVRTNKSQLEITIRFDNNMLRAEVNGDNFYDLVDVAIPKLERQIRKHRTKLEKRLKQDAFSMEYLEEDTMTPELVKTKSFALTSMSIADAEMQLDMLDHDFYVFTNEKSGMVNIIYRRQDGDNGLLDLIY